MSGSHLGSRHDFAATGKHFRARVAALFQFLDTGGEGVYLLLQGDKQRVDRVGSLVVETLELVTSEHICFHDSNLPIGSSQLRAE